MSNPRFPRSLSILLVMLGAVAAVPAVHGDTQVLPRLHYQAAHIEYPAGRTARAIAVGDLDGDGNPDIAVADEVANSVVILSGDRYGAFARAGEFPAGAAPVAIAIADLNGDTAPDIVVADSIGNAVTLLFGPDFETTTSIPVGLNPTSLVVTDIDRNGDPDIAVVNSGSLTLSLLLANGIGGFTRYADRNLNYKAWAVAAGNFDGDGIPDLVVARRSDRLPAIAVLPGRGDYESYLDFPAPPGPYAIATGDLNEDGLDDVIVATESGQLSVRLAGGPSWLGPAHDIAIKDPVDPVYGITRLSGVAVVDVNGDSHLDVVACGIQQIAVLLGDGAGRLLPPYVLEFDVLPNSVVTGDFDRDGHADLAVARAGGLVSVHRGNGDGSFGNERILPEYGGIQRVAIADVDGDHRDDLVAAGIGAWVFAGSADGRLSLVRHTDGPGTRPFRMGDVNHDGHADMVQFGGEGLVVWLSLTGRRDSLVWDGTVPMDGDLSRSESPAIGDVTGDGVPDVVVASRDQVIVLQGEGGGTFARRWTWDMTHAGDFWPQTVEVVRPDGAPGPSLIAVSNGGTELLYEPDGVGALAPIPFDAPVFGNLALGTFNPNGVPDLLYASNLGVSVVPLSLTGATPPYSVGAPISVPVWGFIARAADADGDGLPDLVVGWSSISIAPGRGAYAFGPAVNIVPAVPLYSINSQNMDTGDLNGDGVADIVYACAGGIGVMISGAPPTALMDTLDARMLAAGGARITWRLKNPVGLPYPHVLRAEPGDTVWTDVGTTDWSQDPQVVIDADAPAGTRPWYRLASGDVFRPGPVPAPIRAMPADAPPPPPVYTLALAPVRPNPSGGAVTIDFTLAAPGDVRVDVLDLQGRRIATLVHASLPGGPHFVTWNGQSGGRHTGAGVYFVRLVSSGGTQVRRFARLGGD